MVTGSVGGSVGVSKVPLGETVSEGLVISVVVTGGIVSGDDSSA